MYISAKDLKSSSENDIEKNTKKQIEFQYTNPNKINQAKKINKVALVDDIDKLPNSAKILSSLIKHLETHFSKIIISANSEFEISTLVNIEACNSLTSYDTFEIQRFSLNLRHKLIKKWCLCGSAKTKPELDQQIHKIEELVNTVIGKSLVPSQPIYLLILIQSCIQNQQNELQSSSFAYYYQYIITKSFGEVGVKREELDSLFNYLSRFAWHLRKLETNEIDLTELQEFNRYYSINIDTVELNSRLELLCTAKILIKRGEYHSFTYPYIYLYFLGKFLADNLFKEDIRNTVENYCDNLHKHQNANAILFLTHHNNNHPWIIERILTTLRKCFSETKEMEFNDDISKINSLIETTTHMLIDEPDVEKNQEELRKIEENYDAKLENDFDEGGDINDIEENLNLSLKIGILLRTAEILGQVVKNYYGSLERNVKQPIISEIFSSPLRMIGYVFENITNDPISFVKAIESSLQKEYPNLNPENREKTARIFTFNLLGFIGNGLILRTAQFVNSSKLHEDIKAVVIKNPTNAYKLIEAATHLSQPCHLPFEELRKLAKVLEENPLGFKILQSLGIYHLHQFHMREPDKQKLCSYLDIEITKSHHIDAQTHRKKLLTPNY